MRSVDPWPAAPVLGELPPVARLAMDFDAESLRTDLTALSAETWSEIHIVTGEGVGGSITRTDWRTIPLRSIGGSASRTDPGGPDLENFADTPWLDHLPYFREVLAALPQPLRSVRLMALGPGAQSPVHSDTKWNLPWGVARLHVPIVTLPEATLVIAGEHHCWPAGQLWYADFTRAHSVQNAGDATRVHLVVDVEVSTALLELFPQVFQEPDKVEEYLFPLPRSPLMKDPSDLECRFDVPASFLSWEELDGTFLTDKNMVSASIRPVGESLAMSVRGEPKFGLVHTGNEEFRWAGWTTERSVEVRLDAPRPHLVLRTRRGHASWSRTVPVAFGAAPRGQALKGISASGN